MLNKYSHQPLGIKDKIISTGLLIPKTNRKEKTPALECDIYSFTMKSRFGMAMNWEKMYIGSSFIKYNLSHFQILT